MGSLQASPLCQEMPSCSSSHLSSAPPPLRPPSLHPVPLPEHGSLHLSELFQQPQVSCLSRQTPGCLQRCFLICRPHHLTPGSMVFLMAPVTINYQIESKPLACSRSSSRMSRREGPGAAPDDGGETTSCISQITKTSQVCQKALVYSSCRDSEYPLTVMSKAPMTMMKMMIYIWGDFRTDVDLLIQKGFIEHLLCTRHRPHRLKAARAPQATCRGCCCLPFSSPWPKPTTSTAASSPPPPHVIFSPASLLTWVPQHHCRVNRTVHPTWKRY